MGDLFSLSWWGTIVGGLAIFLMCITFLGEGLKKLAGSKLKDIIDKFTSTPLKGILVGAGVTVIIQSSSATTALAIGLIAAGLMSLKQAVGVIMGANIGTTVTSFLIGLDIASYAPFFLLVGAFLFLIGKSQKLHNLGITIFGFGGLFFGLTLMESCLKPLAALPEFEQIVQTFSNNPFLGVLVGMIGTAAIQSSSAFIGVLQSLFAASSSTVFTLSVAIPILFGSNLGTTITAILASLGGNTAAKRAAGFHVLFNLIGTIIFMLLLTPYCNLVESIAMALNLDPKMQIAIAHILFNTLTTIILFPFTTLLVKFVTKIIPSKKSLLPEIDLSALDKNIMGIVPIKALDIAFTEANKIGDLVILSGDYLTKYVETLNPEYKDSVLQIESNVDIFNDKLNHFLTNIEHQDLGLREMKLYTSLLKVFSDIERISDHHENLIEYLENSKERREKLSSFEKESILKLLHHATLMTSIVIKAFNEHNQDIIFEIRNLENEMDDLTRKIREEYFSKVVKREESRSYIDMVFIDITSNLERIGDHCMNIAEEI